LREMGFSNIYERKIYDLKMAWLIKDGAVEEILINSGGGERLLEKNIFYEFDSKIVIIYHTYS